MSFRYIFIIDSAFLVVKWYYGIFMVTRF